MIETVWNFAATYLEPQQSLPESFVMQTAYPRSLQKKIRVAIFADFKENRVFFLTVTADMFGTAWNFAATYPEP